MITGNHPRCKWILIPPPYVHSFIWMTMYVPYHKDNISMAGPRGFVKIVRLYLLTTDIWICWFDRFAFVKPSYLHLQTSDINSSFGAALDFSQKKFCIFQVQSSAFSFRWYPHLSEPVVFFTAHQSEFTRPNHFHSTLPAEWLMGVVFLSLTNNLQLSKNNSLRLEINVQKALPENSRIILENIWSSMPCPGRASLTLIHIIHQSPPSPRKM